MHLKVKNVGQLAKSHIMYTDTEIEEAAADHFLSVITFSLVNYSKQDCVVLNACGVFTLHKIICRRCNFTLEKKQQQKNNMESLTANVSSM